MRILERTWQCSRQSGTRITQHRAVAGSWFWWQTTRGDRATFAMSGTSRQEPIFNL